MSAAEVRARRLLGKPNSGLPNKELLLQGTLRAVVYDRINQVDSARRGSLLRRLDTPGP